MEASISIQAKHIFGLKSDTHNPVLYLDEQRVVYTAGHNLIIYNIDDRQQTIFPGLEGSLGISCLTLCPKRRFLAVAEKAERGIVFIYDTRKQRKKRPLVTTDCLSHEYVAMAFAPGQESKFIATMGGAPDWTLIFWQWDRQKVLYTAKVSTGARVFHISFHPQDYMQGIIATGENIFKWFKPAEGQLRPQNTGLQRKEAHLSNIYTCHSWIDKEKLVLGTEVGEILIFDKNCEYKGYLTCGMENWSALHIVPYPNGFLVAGDEARVVIFEKNPDDLRLNYSRSQKSLCVSSQPTARVRGISLSPNEDSFVLTLDNSQMYLMAVSSEREEAEPLSGLFHSSGITGLDVCIRKPLVVTCGHDNSVRIWNYIERSLEVIEFFSEEPFSVAFHPSGFQIVVGFADKLRMMNIFAKSLKTYKEIHIKGCKEVRFSHGGHLFAASNNHLVQVFNFYTGENPPHMQFKGHSGKVSSLHWNEDDTVLTSTGWDGAVFEWELCSNAEQSPVAKYFKKGIKFSSVLTSSEAAGKLMLLAGTDKEIKEVNNGVLRRSLDANTVIGHLALLHSERLLIAAVSEQDRPGSLRVYNFEPFDGEFIEVQANYQPIERLRVSYDDSYIFTAGSDGCLIIFEIKGLKRDRESLPFAEEILVTKSEIEELNGTIDNLATTSREIEANHKMQFDIAVNEKQEEIDKLRNQIAQEAGQEKQRYEQLLNNKKEMEQNYEDRIRSMEDNFEQEKRDLQRTFKIKFNKEVERYNDLKKERELNARKASEEIERLRSEHVRVLADMEDDFKSEMEKIKQEIDALHKEKENMNENFEDRRIKLEDTCERQVFDLREQNIQEIQGIQFECEESKAALYLAKQTEEEIKDKKTKKGREVDGMDKELEKQRELIKQLNEEMATNNKEIKVRKKTIKDKERRIHELNKKSQELAKFKFVLDYKIRELRRDTGPRDEEISKLKEQTNEMEKEIKHLESVNEKLGILVENLKLKQDGMQKELDNQKNLLLHNRQKIQIYKDGIYDAVQYIQEEKKLKEAVLGLYRKYVMNDTESKGANTEKEYVKQCNHLETTISNLRKKLNKSHKVHSQSLNRIMSQNVELISEINGLRKEMKYLKYLKKQVDLFEKNKKEKKLPSEEVLRKEVEMQREEINVLRRRLSEIEK